MVSLHRIVIILGITTLSGQVTENNCTVKLTVLQLFIISKDILFSQKLHKTVQSINQSISSVGQSDGRSVRQLVSWVACQWVHQSLKNNNCTVGNTVAHFKPFSSSNLTWYSNTWGSRQFSYFCTGCTHSGHWQKFIPGIQLQHHLSKCCYMYKKIKYHIQTSSYTCAKLNAYVGPSYLYFFHGSEYSASGRE